MEITIKIKTLDSKVTQFTVSPTITIGELKQKIQEQLNVPVEEQKLIYQGRVLKDDKDLTSYGIQEGFTVHMMKSKPQTAESRQTPSNTSSQPSTPSTSVNASPPVNVSVSPNVMVGTIAIPEGAPAPDLNQLLSGVFSSLGLPANLLGGNANIQPQPATTNQGDGTTLVRNLITTLNQNVTSMQQTITELPSSRTNPSHSENMETPNTIENIGSLISQLSSTVQLLGPSMTRLGILLQQESNLQDVGLRNEAQQLSSLVGPIMQQMATLFAILSSSVSSIQFGTTPGSGQAEAPSPQQRHILSPSGNISIRFQNETMNSNTSPTTSQPASGTPPPQGNSARPIRVSLPVFSVQQRASNTNQSGNAQPGTNTAQTNPANLFATMASMLNAQRAAPGTQASGNNQPQTQNQTSQPAQQQSQQFQQTQQPPSQPQPQQSNPLGHMLQGLMSGGNQQGANPFQSLLQSVAPLAQQIAQQMEQSSTSSVSSPQQQNQPNMGQLFSAFTQFMGQPSQPNTTANSVNNNNSNLSAVGQGITSTGTSASMSTVIGSIAQNMGESSEDEGLFGEILQKILSTLSLSDIMAILGGDISHLQRLHPVLRDYLMSLANNDVSAESLDRMTQEIVSNLKDTFVEQNLVPEIKSKVKPGYEVTAIARHVIHKHTRKLLEITLSPMTPESGNPNPFAIAVKEWTAAFVEELIRLLSEAFVGGVDDAIVAIKSFLLERLSFLGEGVAQMGANLISSYAMETYNRIKTEENPQDRSTWENTIVVDEIRQENSPPQRPFSDQYLSGASKKRKAASKTTSSPVSPPNLVADRLEEATKQSNTKPNKKQKDDQSGEEEGASSNEEVIEAIKSTNLGERFVKEVLKKEIKKRIESDPDFDPKKFPNSADFINEEM